MFDIAVLGTIGCNSLKMILGVCWIMLATSININAIITIKIKLDIN